MLLGTGVTIVGSYVFLLVGGRALGEDAFAPVTVMWTLLFLGLTVFLIPVEQFIIRKLTLGGGRASAVRDSWKLIGFVVVGASLLAVVFAFAARGSLLDDDLAFVPVAALMFPFHALLVISRGFLAGRGRFVAYGAAVALDSTGKAAGAIAVAIAGLGSVALVWALALSPILVLLVRPFRAVSSVEPVGVVEPALPRSDRRFMTGFLVATAASQTVLAAGPLVYGSGFRPTATLAALAAAGVIVGIVGLGITQVLVGRGETDRMAVAWLVAVAAAAIAIVVVQSDPTIRVVAGFLTGEVVALAGLTASALIRPGQHVSSSLPDPPL
jgi:O-antigen/teichoic acid export membrane protein